MLERFAYIQQWPPLRQLKVAFVPGGNFTFNAYILNF